MATTTAVAIAGLFQFLLRTSFFIEQKSDKCSKAPVFSSWIFLAAFLDFLLDTPIYPSRYKHLPYVIQLIVEIIFAVLFTEFGTKVVWCTLEKLFCQLVEIFFIMTGISKDVYYKWGSLILGSVTTTVSLLILACVGQATYHFPTLSNEKYKRRVKKVSICEDYILDEDEE